MCGSLSAFALGVPSIWMFFLPLFLVILPALQTSVQLYHCHREVFPALTPRLSQTHCYMF